MVRQITNNEKAARKKGLMHRKGPQGSLFVLSVSCTFVLIRSNQMCKNVARLFF